MKYRFLIVSLLAISFSISSLATGVQKLLTVTSDAKPGQTFFINVGMIDNSMEIKELQTGGTDGNNENFTVDDIKKQTPVLVWDDRKSKSRAVVTLDARKVSPLTGGKITIVYLKNGITNKTERFSFDLDRDGDRWVLIADVDGAKRTFNTMFLRKNTFMGQTIGIDEVVVK